MFCTRPKSLLALVVFLFPSCLAAKGLSLQCCDFARNSGAYIDKTVPNSSYTCGQQFSPTSNAAPDLSVPLSWCRANCSGSAIYPPSETNAWALPLVTFILAAVIFSMTIPRRLGSRTPHSDWYWAPFWLIWDAFVLVLDTVFWVFAIMTATGPLILSGLFEIRIDYKVTRYLTRARKKEGDDQLTRKETVEVLTAVLAGNLEVQDIRESGVDPQAELEGELNIAASGADITEKISVRLRDMLDGQVAFNTTVGAPVLLYIGSFIYSIVSLSGMKGDKDTARALAFGIWWMIIVHVSVISGSLLASNNPSSASIICPRKVVPYDRSQRRTCATKRFHMEDRIQGRIDAFLLSPSSNIKLDAEGEAQGIWRFWPLALSYDNRYEPVWMWTRGKNKALWLRRTAAWQHPWVRKRMKVSSLGWLFLIVFSYFLVFLPCALAFWIEYTTPPIGIGCRALTILCYAGCQLTFVLLSAWSHTRVLQESVTFSEERKSISRLKAIVAILLLFPTWILALFTTFAGTLMQITGIYQNCLCAATFPAWSTVSLASDTEKDRRSSKYWNYAGYIAVGFLFLITYISWWLQRFLRDVFLKRADSVINRDTELMALNGEPTNQGSTGNTSSTV